jgi:hypothetical protein
MTAFGFIICKERMFAAISLAASYPRPPCSMHPSVGKHGGQPFLAMLQRMRTSLGNDTLLISQLPLRLMVQSALEIRDDSHIQTGAQPI